jgi:signal transduction histidine kinase
MGRLEDTMALVFPRKPVWIFERFLGGNSYLQALEKHAARLEQSQQLQQAITQIIVRSTDLTIAVPQIIRAICETTHWDLGEVWYINRDLNALVREAHWHHPAFDFPTFEQASTQIHFKMGEGLPGRVWATGKPIWITNVVDDGSFLRARYARQDGLHGAFCAPIRTDGEVIGVMAFFSREPRRIDYELLRVLETVGSQIGLFIERKRLESTERAHAHAIAVLEERRRLACDLHDSVTQTLFSASVIAEMLPRLWERDPERARDGLEELAGLTRGALSEMRGMLTEMRGESSAHFSDLPAHLQTLIDTLTQRGSVRATLCIDGNITLPAPVQLVFYRVAQESMNNIAKHARATHAQVTLHRRADRVELCIRDDGRGFDMASVPAGHLGLEIMRERAALVGADYRIESMPGRGTTVRLVWSVAG